MGGQVPHAETQQEPYLGKNHMDVGHSGPSGRDNSIKQQALRLAFFVGLEKGLSKNGKKENLRPSW